MVFSSLPSFSSRLEAELRQSGITQRDLFYECFVHYGMLLAALSTAQGDLAKKYKSDLHDLLSTEGVLLPHVFAMMAVEAQICNRDPLNDLAGVCGCQKAPVEPVNRAQYLRGVDGKDCVVTFSSDFDVRQFVCGLDVPSEPLLMVADLSDLVEFWTVSTRLTLMALPGVVKYVREIDTDRIDVVITPATLGFKELDAVLASVLMS